MTIHLPNTIKDIYFCGDLHGNLEYLKYIINNYHLTDSVIFICGDVGLGFQPKWERSMIDFINKKLVATNCYIIGVRGNHDDPLCFQDIDLVKDNGQSRNWLNVPDYTIVHVLNQNILCVGGGTSIDRMYRLEMGYGYWSNETIQYQPKVTEHIDIICSHSAPSFCYPVDKGDIVFQFAQSDPKLLEDLDNERKLLDCIYDDYKDDVTHWYYGHFHKSQMQLINKTTFKLLNIAEICRHVSSDNNDLL